MNIDWKFNNGLVVCSMFVQVIICCVLGELTHFFKTVPEFSFTPFSSDTQAFGLAMRVGDFTSPLVKPIGCNPVCRLSRYCTLQDKMYYEMGWRLCRPGFYLFRRPPSVMVIITGIFLANYIDTAVEPPKVMSGVVKEDIVCRVFFSSWPPQMKHGPKS